MIPLGKEAEEAGEVGRAFSSIDSLQATPLLFWAAGQTGDDRFRDCAVRHTSRVLGIHVRADGSVIQSSELDAETGRVIRQFTHKGYSEASIWGRAQAWAMIYSAMAAAQERAKRRGSMTRCEPRIGGSPTCRPASSRSGISATRRFRTPKRYRRNRDCLRGAPEACSACADAALRARYRGAAEQTAAALVGHYLTPTQPGEQRPAGMLIGACFNKRADSRPQDRANLSRRSSGAISLRGPERAERNDQGRRKKSRAVR